MSEQEMKWTEEAEARLSRIPEGFMRTMTRKRIEEHAVEKGIPEISLKVAEEVIDSSRAGMGSAMGGDMAMPDYVKDMLAAREADAAPEKESKNEKFFFCFVCNFAVPEKPPEECPNCGSGSEKFSKLEEEFRTEAHTLTLEWSSYAGKYLEKIPEGFERRMSRFEIEAFARRSGYKVVTGDVIDERLKVWGDISKKMVSEMDWEPEVKEKIDKIPEQIRGMVMREMEIFAKNAGEKTVSNKTLDVIREKWSDSREFHVKWQ
ncbi:MAG: hypothetical protein ACE5FU_08000 [Nitrospinota bacterium]